MKFTKLSLVAALAVSAAFAGGDIAPVEPVVETPSNKCAECGDITGAIKLYYGSYDRGANADLFDKNGALGDAYAELNYSRKLMDNVTANVGMAYITTLGLEGDLVSGTWANHGPAPTVDDVAWITTANVAIQLANTTLVLGRQQLATPFFYSETWGIAANTFDAAVAVNTDLPDTTLVAAWVGRGNGTAGGAIVNLNNQNFDGGHNELFGSEAAFAFGAINKSISDVTLQAWYYNVTSAEDALWLQADANFGSISVGAQYAATYAQSVLATNDTDAYAFKVGYEADALSAYVAYSYRGNDASALNIANIATGAGAGSQSSLYTETYWNYGFVGQQDAETIALGASYDLGMAKVAAQYTTVSTSVANTATTGDMNEFALTASTKVGPINTDLAYVYDEKGVAGNAANTVLVMLSLPFSL